MQGAAHAEAEEEKNESVSEYLNDVRSARTICRFV